MQIDMNSLATLYAGYSETEFLALRRKDLIAAAKPYYDYERERRGLPEYELFRPEPQGLLRQAHQRRRKGFLFSVLYAIPLCFLFWRFRVYGIGPVALLALVCMSVTQRYRGNDVVLWLRRFHFRWHKTSRLDQKLVTALKGFGVGMTIQDSNIKRSGFTLLLIWRAYLTSALYVVPFFLFFLVPQVWAWTDQSETHELWGFIVPLVAIYAFICFFNFKRLGFKRINAKDAAGQIKTAIATAQRGGDGLLSELLVFKCPESCWKEAVQESLREASVLLVDVTEPSENVVWELQTSLGILPRELIILSCAIKLGDPLELPGSSRRLLASVLGEEELNKTSIFFYPVSWRFPTSLRHRLELQLATAIADCEYFAYLKDRHPELARASVGRVGLQNSR